MKKKTAQALTALTLLLCFGLQTPLSAQTTVTGTLTFNFAINIQLGPTATPTCTGTATVSDTGSGAIITETATADADGPFSNATCSVSIHYTWHLTSPTTDKIKLSYFVSAPIPFGNLGATETRTAQTQNFITISVPANGKTTTENVTVTLN